MLNSRDIGLLRPDVAANCRRLIELAAEEALVHVLLPEIQAFFESEEGQREYAEWKKQQAEHQK